MTQPLQICIGPTIRIGLESWCLSYAGFFLKNIDHTVLHFSISVFGPEQDHSSDIVENFTINARSFTPQRIMKCYSKGLFLCYKNQDITDIILILQAIHR